MRKGFIFNHNKCVSCNACSAACIIENGWNIHPRNIYSYNSKADHLLPVINLSLACNHCESAVCMDGCPASAFTRDTFSGAVVIDENKCIGCRYCQWNCPYDAPKFSKEAGTINKCHLCYIAISEGGQPACSTACPTGALGFGDISENGNKSDFSWFPGKNLNPSIRFISNNNVAPLKIIPAINQETESQKHQYNRDLSADWSLIIFSFLSTISVAALMSSLFSGVFPSGIIFISFLILTGSVSLLHLGKKFRSWRSVSNLRNSPLSREVFFFIIYAAISSVTVLLRSPELLIVSCVAGLIFLMLIDSVYIYAWHDRSIILHSGQTFITALLIVPFVSGIVLPFIFIALIKSGLFFYRLSVNKLSYSNVTIRFFRISLLIVTGMSLILHNTRPEIFIILLFLTGELLDRIIFYLDFNPLNINALIDKQYNIDRDEKKGNK